MNLIDKVFLSHPDFQQKNCSLIINFVLDNSYPLNFIFSCIRKRLAKNSTEKINPTPLLIPITMIILLYHMSSVLLKSLCNFLKIFLISN